MMLFKEPVFRVRSTLSLVGKDNLTPTVVCFCRAIGSFTFCSNGFQPVATNKTQLRAVGSGHIYTQS